MGHRPRRTRQRRPRRLGPVFIVACEGRKTEYEYLSRLNRSTPRRDRPVLKPVAGSGGTAIGTVEAAIRQRDKDWRAEHYSKKDGDKAYALVDVEPHDPAKAEALDAALKLAEAKEVVVLVSNPCFEFWLLCHVADARDVCRSFDDPKSVDKELQKRGGYGKDALHANPSLLDKLLPKAPHAVTVARHVHEKHHVGMADVRAANACTTVYQLVACLLGEQDVAP